MVSLEAFSELLEVLYSAPLDQEQWQRFLTLLCGYTQGKNGYFFCADSRLGLSVRATSGAAHAAQSAMDYNQRYAVSDPYHGALVRNARTGVFQGNDLFPDESLLQTEMYRVLLAPAGNRYVTLIPLTLSARRFEAISIWRSPEDGPMDEDGNRMLNLLVPHIQKALQIRQVLGVTRQRLAGAEAMADASSTATLLLTRTGHVLHCNAAAQSLLQQSGALTLHDGSLIPTQARFKEPLRKLFANAASPIAPHWKTTPAHALSLPRAAGPQPLQLLAAPLPLAYRSRSHADLVLLITDPAQPIAFPDTILRSLYNLTPAQTEVANGLLTGYTLEEIANLRQVSLGTIRCQLKTILHKTNTTRQSDLVRLLMTLPPFASAN